jgi:hypothetical protein
MLKFAQTNIDKGVGGGIKGRYEQANNKKNRAQFHKETMTWVPCPPYIQNCTTMNVQW